MGAPRTTREHRRWRHRLSKRLDDPSVWECLGPGLITGAADDDPSGIATYSQTGAQFGVETLWTLWLTYPLMVAMQYVSALIGRVTGAGLAHNIARRYPAPVVWVIVTALFVANVINLGADVGAMGESVRLLIGGPALLWTVLLGLIALLLIVLLSFHAYSRLLKYLTLSLFAYAAVLFFVHIDWGQVARASVWPHIQWSNDYLTAVVAILGTTISPYLFFWQASHEVESQRQAPHEQPLKRAPAQAAVQLRRMRLDTLIGMGVSNVVALCIMLTAAAVLHAHGVNDVDSAAQAAKALEPVAGRFSVVLFALGIVGTGMLAIPTLSGSAAYAVAETFHWKKGLDLHWLQARGFYATIAFGTLLGVAMNGIHLNPMRALYWSAVINGLVAVPLMVIIMLLAGSPAVMGRFTASRKLRWGGWLATVVMGLAAVSMIGSWFAG